MRTKTTFLVLTTMGFRCELVVTLHTHRHTHHLDPSLLSCLSLPLLSRVSSSSHKMFPESIYRDETQHCPNVPPSHRPSKRTTHYPVYPPGYLYKYPEFHAPANHIPIIKLELHVGACKLHNSDHSSPFHRLTRIFRLPRLPAPRYNGPTRPDQHPRLP